jgi:hypothetical protein
MHMQCTATIYDSDKDDQKHCSLFHSAEESRERGRGEGEREDRGVTGLVSVSGHYNHAVSALTL